MVRIRRGRRIRIRDRNPPEFLPRNIARPLLDSLAERCTLERPEVVSEQLSADGTRKWLLRMPPADRFDKGAEIECVYIPESDRGTLCVSSQVGCTLNCPFCHTGTMPLVRNLTVAEIVGQVLVARDRLGDFPGGVTRRFPDLNFALLANILRESYDGKRGWRHFESSFFITRTTPGNLFWQSGTTYILPILRPPWFRPGLYLEPSLPGGRRWLASVSWRTA